MFDRDIFYDIIETIVLNICIIVILNQRVYY